MTAPSAKSLILDLLSTLRGRSMPVRALVEAARLFAIEENNLRVSLARLCTAGIVDRDERGSYRLGASSAALERQITSWRRLEQRVCAWRGGWIGVHGAAPTRGAAARRSARALRFLGFAALEPGLMLRPDNLKGGIAEVRSELRALDLAEHLAVLGVCELDLAREHKARALWDTALLAERYERYRAELATSRARLARVTREVAMVESFLLGGSVLRELVQDPLLPEAIANSGARDALVAAMRDYDRIGRAAWADFLRDHGVVQLQAPADLRLGEAESRFSNLSNTGVPA